VVLKMIKYCARDEECVRLIVKVRNNVWLRGEMLLLAHDEHSYIFPEVDLYCHDSPDVE
jgi:hypothetical protein